MKSKVVAMLETRAGAHLAELVARRGGVALLAPALEASPPKLGPLMSALDTALGA